jgi:hypothetical protein
MDSTSNYQNQYSSNPRWTSLGFASTRMGLQLTWQN